MDAAPTTDPVPPGDTKARRSRSTVTFSSLGYVKDGCPHVIRVRVGDGARPSDADSYAICASVETALQLSDLRFDVFEASGTLAPDAVSTTAVRTATLAPGLEVAHAVQDPGLIEAAVHGATPGPVVAGPVAELAIGVLGPLTVAVEGRQVHVGPVRHRILLAALALRANQRLTNETLIDLAWPDQLPEQPRKALYEGIQQLRAELGPTAGARISTQPGGFTLHLREDELDAQVFLAAVRRGQDTLAGGQVRTAAVELSSALSLWRGSLLADVPSRQLHLEFGETLAVRRQLATEQLLEARIRSAASFPNLVAEAERLLASDPWSEKLHGLLMAAQYVTGCRTDAVATYRAFRTALRDELGLEPGEHLRLLQAQIIAGTPRTDLMVGEMAVPDRSRGFALGAARATDTFPTAMTAPVSPYVAAGYAPPPLLPSVAPTGRSRLPRWYRTRLIHQRRTWAASAGYFMEPPSARRSDGRL